MRHLLPVALLALCAACEPEEIVDPPPPPAPACSADKACTRQSDCGAVGKMICGGKCCGPAGAFRDGSTEVATGSGRAVLSFSSTIRNAEPPRARVWVFHSKNPDGALTCAKVMAGASPDMSAMNSVYSDPPLRQLNFSGGVDTLYLNPYTLPAGSALVVYVEVYSTISGDPPPLGRGCSDEGNTVAADSTTNFYVTVE